MAWFGEVQQRIPPSVLVKASEVCLNDKNSDVHTSCKLSYMLVPYQQNSYYPAIAIFTSVISRSSESGRRNALGWGISVKLFLQLSRPTWVTVMSSVPHILPTEFQFIYVFKSVYTFRFNLGVRHLPALPNENVYLRHRLHGFCNLYETLFGPWYRAGRNGRNMKQWQGYNLEVDGGKYVKVSL
jgi:hypothetical protein